MQVVLIDSPVANVANIHRALRAAGADVTLTSDPATIVGAGKIVLPGVGSFAAAMSWLDENGVSDALRNAVAHGASLLGICVGHQLLFDDSDEDGTRPGLGLLRGSVRKFSGAMPVPQIGWNRVYSSHPLFDGIADGTPLYFVNSYRVAGADAEIASSEYAGAFTAAAANENVMGVQFHPEKSSTAGQRLLRNFCCWDRGRPRPLDRRRPAGAYSRGRRDAGRPAGGTPAVPTEIIASLDVLNGNVVRLRRGAFDDVTTYGDPATVLQRLNIPKGARLHVVDLEGSRSGAPRELETIARLRGYQLQVGGGIRNADDAKAWLSAGANKVVIGTLAADAPDELARIVDAIGSEHVIAAIDVDREEIRVDGWTRGASRSIEAVIETLERLGIAELLATDINRDGMLGGPSLELYRRLAGKTNMRLIASGGVTTLGDVVSLARNPAVGGAIVGRALLDGRITYEQATARAALRDALPERVIPCLDVRDGRVVKGVQFRELRDAGDPVECARRYEAEGADELVMLDVSATDTGRATALATVERVAAALFIPLTVGGGVRTIDDFRALLRAGADRVAINTAAVRDPQLIARCAREFGVQAVVLSCDADGDGNVIVRSGKEAVALNAVDWCRKAEELGAGEILLTSVDRDGTASGFDLPLIRSVASSVSIGVIASGGAGNAAHFCDAIEIGGARAVLAASLFHDRVLTIGDAKAAMAAANIPVREVTQCSM